MSLLDDYRDSLHKVGNGSVNLLEQKRKQLEQEIKRLTYSQVKLYYSPTDFSLPELPEFGGGMPDCILNFRLSSRIRRLIFDPANRWAWNRIDRRLNG